MSRNGTGARPEIRKFPARLPDAQEMLEKLGPEYGGLLKVVKEFVPSEYRVVMGHRFSYRGRKFVHLALKSDTKLISLVITRKVEGESFAKNGLRPAIAHAGIAIYRGSVQRFAIAGFESREHLAYLVSDLGEQPNLNMAAALAAPIQDLLSKLEG
jgi:hypothetical protein